MLVSQTKEESPWRARQHKQDQLSNIQNTVHLQEDKDELLDLRDKLKVVTSKFQNARKERDQLKQEKKELEQEVLQLQANMRQMVPCASNTSSIFPMLNELQNLVGDFYKIDCQDVFFDLLVPELNFDGIIYFF